MTALPSPGDPFHPAGVRRPPTLADLLRREMDHRGITSIAKLGDALGVGFGTAWRWLNTPARPRDYMLVRIAKFCHVPITEVRAVVGRPPGEVETLTWPDDLNELTLNQQMSVIAIARMMRDAPKGQAARR